MSQQQQHQPWPCFLFGNYLLNSEHPTQFPFCGWHIYQSLIIGNVWHKALTLLLLITIITVYSKSTPIQVDFLAARKEHRALKAHYIFSFFLEQSSPIFQCRYYNLCSKRTRFFAYKEAAVHYKYDPGNKDKNFRKCCSRSGQILLLRYNGHQLSKSCDYSCYFNGMSVAAIALEV